MRRFNGWRTSSVGRKYFIFGFNRGDNFEEHAWKTRWEGVNREGAEQTPTKAQISYDQEGREVNRRVRHLDAAVGLDSRDVHMSGDPCVVVAEIPDGKGTVTQYVERYSTSGKFLGSYAVDWNKTAEDC